MNATRQIQRKIDSLRDQQARIAKAVRLRKVYAMLKDRKSVGGNEGYCRQCLNTPKEKRCRHPKFCYEWLYCCSAQGSCGLDPRHKGPHLMNGTDGWVIFSADRRIEAKISELDERRLWPVHRRLINGRR